MLPALLCVRQIANKTNGDRFQSMPEGPEIRRAADKIEAVLKDKRVEKIEFG